MLTTRRSRTVAVLTALLVSACCLIGAPTAAQAATSSAAKSVNSTSNCATKNTTQAFKKWGDSSWYYLLAGGDMETPTAWTLTGGASFVNGNEAYNVAPGSADKKSLLLPAGSTATITVNCVPLNLSYRFFVKALTSRSSSDFAVYERVTGAANLCNCGYIDYLNPGPAGSWVASPQLATLNSSYAYTNGSYQTISFTFSTAKSTWQVDDIMMDPLRLD